MSMVDQPDVALLDGIEFPLTAPSGMDREDLLQETYLRVLKNRRKLEHRSAGEQLAYSRRAARSAVTDQARRAARTKRGPGRDRPLLEDPQADQTSPSGRAMRREESEQAMVALGRLPEDQRRAIQFKHLEGRPVSEAARLMGISPAAVAGLLRRGLQRLRQELTEGV